MSKLDREYSRDHNSKRALFSHLKEEKQHPTILLKTRGSERALSPTSKGNLSAQNQKLVSFCYKRCFSCKIFIWNRDLTVFRKEGENSQPVYQLHSKPSTTDCKIIDICH